MDQRMLFSDPDLKEEFLDQFRAIAESAANALEARSYAASVSDGKRGGAIQQSFGESMPRVGGRFEGATHVVDEARRAPARVTSVRYTVDEGRRAADTVAAGGRIEDRWLEAIVQRFGRPVHFIQDAKVREPKDDVKNSAVIAEKIRKARSKLHAAIPSVGRVDITNHQLRWLGTAWMLRPGIVVTNRHVAEAFALKRGSRFVFRTNWLRRRYAVSVDWRHEYDRSHVAEFGVPEVLWMEPPASRNDAALLRLADSGKDGNQRAVKPPFSLEGMSATQERSLKVGDWIAVIGYPAFDSRNDFADQQRIFDGVYDVKRLAVGQITALRPDGILTHDATTLGGNSGSVVLHLATGRVAALHFGGLEGTNNYAVRASTLSQIVERRLG